MPRSLLCVRVWIVECLVPEEQYAYSWSTGLSSLALVRKCRLLKYSSDPIIKAAFRSFASGKSIKCVLWWKCIVRLCCCLWWRTLLLSGVARIPEWGEGGTWTIVECSCGKVLTNKKRRYVIIFSVAFNFFPSFSYYPNPHPPHLVAPTQRLFTNPTTGCSPNGGSLATLMLLLSLYLSDFLGAFELSQFGNVPWIGVDVLSKTCLILVR